MNNRFLTPDHSEDHSQTIQLLELSAIRCDCGTQIRAALNENTVTEYAEAMLAGATFPAVIVFHDGSQYVLADGFHRLMANARRGTLHIRAEVRQGTKSDALKYALQANSKHGLKRTNADKRRSVKLAVTEWPSLSNREIARICAVHHDLVGEVRQDQLAESASSIPAIRVGADGRQRRSVRNGTSTATTSKNCSLKKETGLELRNGAESWESLCDKTLKAQIETNNDELEEILSRPLSGIQEAAAYHLNIARDDAELILAALRENTFDLQQLLAAVVELKLLMQVLEALARRSAGATAHN
ncbi:MAG TPA: ParB N-terminal domain-containing protein [Verrucomicrobiae bacterium]|nr:ParB N-terminal domain-containing protein [Verrucomicrobiae bacterium]